MTWTIGRPLSAESKRIARSVSRRLRELKAMWELSRTRNLPTELIVEGERGRMGRGLQTESTHLGTRRAGDWIRLRWRQKMTLVEIYQYGIS